MSDIEIAVRGALMLAALLLWCAVGGIVLWFVLHA